MVDVDALMALGVMLICFLTFVYSIRVDNRRTRHEMEMKQIISDLGIKRAFYC